MNDPAFWVDLIKTLGLPLVMALIYFYLVQTERIVSGKAYERALAEIADLKRKLADNDSVWMELALRGAFASRRSASITERAVQALQAVDRVTRDSPGITDE